MQCFQIYKLQTTGTEEFVFLELLLALPGSARQIIDRQQNAGDQHPHAQP